MLTEQEVHNVISGYVVSAGIDVLQLVSPGGQAPLSITFYVDGKRRTIYPDLLAIREGDVIVGELKSRYSVADHQKLKTVKRYGATALVALVRRKRPQWSEGGRIILMLGHSQENTPILDDVEQWVVGSANSLLIK